MQYGSRLKVMQEGTLPKEINNDWHIGSRVARIDVGEKVLGTGKNIQTIFTWMVCFYGSALRSKYPRARVLSIDKTKALALPGVEAVVTAEDIPGENKIGHLKHDQYTLIPIGGLTIIWEMPLHLWQPGIKRLRIRQRS